jgi:serine/threonine-protein kinase HipA
MENRKLIIVSILLNSIEKEVGELVFENGKIYFKYYSSFIKSGFNISPLKLQFNTEIQQAKEVPFNGLFGVFEDSMPDGWGRLLLDRCLSSKGVNISTINSLDRLAFVGNQGMGALIYKPEFDIEGLNDFKIDLDEYNNESKKILNGYDSEYFDELIKLNGSSGGARPKILVSYDELNNKFYPNTYPFDEQHSAWLIKFPSSSDKIDIANIEYAYHLMALDSGIEMSDCKLFKGKKQQYYFGTKRFDRIGKNRLHVHSAAGIIHDNFRLSSMDYGHLMDCAYKLENNINAYAKILRIAAFNVFSNNRDDHSKNFSFLVDENQNWQLAPAYDLTFSNTSNGFHSTMVAGESKQPGYHHLIKLANHFKIPDAASIIEHVKEIIFNWNLYADKAVVSKQSKKIIEKTIEKNYSQSKSN